MKGLFALPAVVVLAVAVGWGLETKTESRLRREHADALHENRRLAQLRAEHKQLIAAQPSAAAWDKLLRDAAEAAQLRKPIATSAKAETSVTVDAVSEPAPPALSNTWMTVTELKNRGRATPADAMETVFWAATNGDVSVIRDTIELAPDSRAALLAILARLARQHSAAPAPLRQPRGSGCAFRRARRAR